MLQRVLIGLILAQTLGFMLLSWQLVSWHKYHMRMQILNGTYTGKIKTLYLTRLEEVNHLKDEFELDGIMYDVISVKPLNRGFMVSALEDCTEQILLGLLIGSERGLECPANQGAKTILQFIYLDGLAEISERLSLLLQPCIRLISIIESYAFYSLSNSYSSVLWNPPESDLS